MIGFVGAVVGEFDGGSDGAVVGSVEGERDGATVGASLATNQQDKQDNEGKRAQGK
jgi:hypothetical protein